MPNQPLPPFKTATPAELRQRAQARLRGDHIALTPAGDPASHAMKVLYELAASPDTAPNALALLHELQVHQVELELQAEALQAAHDELAAALARQVELYDGDPTPYLTIDPDTRVCHANLAAARRLGLARSALVGLRLDAFVSPPSALQQLLALPRCGSEISTDLLHLAPHDAPACTVGASVSADPAGGRFLITLAELPPA